MIRGKAAKKESLSIEEKLEQALVPDWEQPYKVPENWVWTRLGEIGQTNIGLTYKPTDISIDGTIVLRSSNIQNGIMDYNDIIKVQMEIGANKMSQKGDILICARNGSKALVGKCAIIDENGMSFGAFMALFRSDYNRLIYYFLNSHYFRDIIDKDVGTTTINQITQSILKESYFPLPPLAEQRRIVDYIESLFAKLDEAKEKVQAALDSFENRKATILHQAFTGELTKKWREENGIELDGWEEATLGNFLLKMTTKKPTGEIFGYIDIDAIDNKNQRVFEPKILPVLKAPSRASREVIENDILFSMVRPYLKNIAFIDCELSDCIASTGFYVCRPKENLHPRFLYNFMCSQDTIDYLMQFMKGDNSPSIRGSNLENMPFKAPSLPEQTEIVRILDSIFEKEQQAKELASVIKKIDLMKKAILARAFRGELGTNDPKEESAKELLKEILEVKF